MPLLAPRVSPLYALITPHIAPIRVPAMPCNAPLCIAFSCLDDPSYGP